MRHPTLALLALVTLLAACGGGTSAHSAAGSGGSAVAADEVLVSGQVTARGTKGALLVFAYAGDADPTASEPLSVASVEADGSFAISLPPLDGSLSLIFLADGANDGVIDGGDPVSVLTASVLAGLPGGSSVTLDDVGLDFTSKKAHAGNVDVRQPGAAAAAQRTPTPVPAG
ncbi:MAG: hypothetical protein ABI629_24855 [bacterium]